ncbi:hypothetical protein TWF694_005351 [Orbilia ellipsospora]|uniref:Nucleoside phosphorylase domain-containing protein n=1 Tax=Orbilia ellipsospora TaxID=2528407 RepID=A0AAV9WSU4_9PEZI
MSNQVILDSPGLYNIGWIASLPTGRASATALLDERHGEPHGFSQHPCDTNSYTWGRMGKHNIVIASLEAGTSGTTSAATTASNMLSSLPHIKTGLLVGTGAGVARPDSGIDIRLGDVVVSKPDGSTGGVVQYDLMKAKLNSARERKDFLNKPPSVLLHALANIQAEHHIAESEVPELLEKMWAANPGMKKSTRAVPGFVHQGLENDLLFKAEYSHVGSQYCCKCDQTEVIQRDMRDSTDPEIHYGIIASGNTMIKDSAVRERILQDIGQECLCIEMEAAGVMNHFPCIIIKGICNYADSHKNDRWQPYASATAAAFAKELLRYVPRQGPIETQKVINASNSPTSSLFISRWPTMVYNKTSNSREEAQDIRRIKDNASRNVLDGETSEYLYHGESSYARVK